MINRDDLTTLRQNLTDDATRALATYNQAQGAIQLLDHLLLEMDKEEPRGDGAIEGARSEDVDDGQD
jgi:hypothetical protein